jgi:glycosyltransferase involved in cell wall biosynthesis
VLDRLRLAANTIASFCPGVRRSFRQASVILCKTPETVACVPRVWQKKCRIVQDVAVEKSLLADEPTDGPAAPRFLYIGRLLYWKGVHLGLYALARVLEEYPDARLTIVGQGKDSPWLHRLAHRLGIAQSVDWKGWIRREEALEIYRQYTALLFPSLHDSGGTVVMEALSRGVPVICLDCGGPGAMLPFACGFKIAVKGTDQEQVIEGLADAMRRLAGNTKLRREMSARILQAARENLWEHLVSRTYRQIEETFIS